MNKGGARTKTEAGRKVVATGQWGRFPTYCAKIGTLGSSCVLIKRVRQFHEGQHIYYCDEPDLHGMSTGCTPTWHRGCIWKIEDNRLFINK